MAIGDVTDYSGGEVKAIELLASSIATNSPPSGASAGLSTKLIRRLFSRAPSVCTLLVYSTAGSATMTVTCRLWGYNPVGAGFWTPVGTGTDAGKGVINEGNAIGETGTDTIRHVELLSEPCAFERLYLEITAIGGTSTAVTGKLIVSRPVN